MLQAAGLLAVAPLLRGGIKKMKATMQTRKGPPLLQGYYDLAKLLRKETVRSETASWVYVARPAPLLRRRRGGDDARPGPRRGGAAGGRRRHPWAGWHPRARAALRWRPPPSIRAARSAAWAAAAR